jgi:hypothetical protein
MDDDLRAFQTRAELLAYTWRKFGEADLRAVLSRAKNTRKSLERAIGELKSAGLNQVADILKEYLPEESEFDGTLPVR